VKEILKNKFNKSHTQVVAKDPAPVCSPVKEMRNWMGVSDKVSAKDMEKIDQSKFKNEEIDIDK